MNNAEGAVATVENSTISNNDANIGGGVANQGWVELTNTIVTSNTANNSGGGISTSGAGDTLLENSTISSNTVRGRGGGVFNGGSTEVSDSTIINNRAEGSTSGSRGGGIHNSTGDVSIIRSSFISNTADIGGGIYSSGNSFGVSAETNINESNIVNNVAKSIGGGIYNDLGLTTIQDSRILNNSAQYEGGGIYNREDVDNATHVTSSCIAGNSDTSFFNDAPAQQYAGYNWWGAVGGPNTPGADTVGGNVDTGGYTTTPLLDCVPELRVSKSNDRDGKVAPGDSYNWTLTISNTGIINAEFSNGETILVDELPAGPSYGDPLTGDFVNITNETNLSCGIADGALSCTVIGAGLIVGPGGYFEVSFSVTPNQPGSLSNPDGLCYVDPDGLVAEGDENDNNCNMDTVIVEETPVDFMKVYLPLTLMAK